MTEIIYKEWRQDFIFEEASLYDVLVIRASKGNLEFQCPVWIEDEQTIRDCKDLLAEKINNYRRENGL